MWEFIDREIKKSADSKEEPLIQTCRPEAGQPCPNCGRGNLDYNSLLNLVCPACGYESTANFT